VVHSEPKVAAPEPKAAAPEPKAAAPEPEVEAAPEVVEEQEEPPYIAVACREVEFININCEILY
jgi:hypothetical protein